MLAIAPRRSRRWVAVPRRSSAGSMPRADSTRSARSAVPVGRRSRTRAMRALPVGVPKLMVSTVASGNKPYVGTTDVTMMPSIVDVAGINRIRRGSSRTRPGRWPGWPTGTVTTSADDEAADRCVDVGGDDPVRDDGSRAARGARLRGARLPPDRHRGQVDGGADAAGGVDGVLDVTPTELADELWVRHLVARARAARGGRAPRHPAGRLARCAGCHRHLSHRASGPAAGAVPRPADLRPRRADGRDTRDAGRVPASSAAVIARKLNAATGPDRAVRAATRLLAAHDRGAGARTTREADEALSRPCASASTARRWRYTRSMPTSTTQRSHSRWRSAARARDRGPVTPPRPR